ncbi:hypothetical protein YC2023_092409 [Brassica napus]
MNGWREVKLVPSVPRFYIFGDIFFDKFPTRGMMEERIKQLTLVTGHDYYYVSNVVTLIIGITVIINNVATPICSA